MENKSFHRKIESSKIRNSKLKVIKGFNLDNVKITDLLNNYEGIGFQASHLSQASKIIKKMQKQKTTIFLSMTSNIVSSGLREVIAQLCKNKLIHGIITTTGSIEEDFMKSQSDFFLGSFDLDDELVKQNGMNRMGNILVPDENYAKLEEWHMEFISLLYEEKQSWSPSEYIKKMGLSLKDEDSILYWCAKNNIPIYCPGFVDGAMGDHFYFFNKKKEREGKKTLIIDTANDLKLFYNQILAPDKVSGIIVGGGIAKHHLIGAAILRDGLDYAVYISTGTEYDGSLSGAKPREAVSWNKLKNDKDNYVEVHADATLVLPLLAIGMLSE